MGCDFWCLWSSCRIQWTWHWPAIPEAPVSQCKCCCVEFLHIKIVWKSLWPRRLQHSYWSGVVLRTSFETCTNSSIVLPLGTLTLSERSAWVNLQIWSAGNASSWRVLLHCCRWCFCWFLCMFGGFFRFILVKSLIRSHPKPERQQSKPRGNNWKRSGLFQTFRAGGVGWASEVGELFGEESFHTIVAMLLWWCCYKQIF